VAVAGKCPAGCTACTSLTACTSCAAGYELSEFGCQTFCPTNSSNNDSSTCQDLMPSLYLDRLFVWNTQGQTQLQTTGGFNFSLTWRHSLSGVFATALGLYNFKVAPHYVLSYRAELLSLSITGATLNLEPVGGEAGIIFLAFTLVVITEDSSYLELVTFTKTGLTEGAYPAPVLTANSSKFDFNNVTDTPIMTTFYQWVTGSTAANYSSINYWSSFYTAYFSLNNSDYELLVNYTTGSLVYLTGVKTQMLLVRKTVGLGGTAVFQINSQVGKYLSATFYNNLAVPVAYFGQPSSARSCLHGLNRLDLYLYRDASEPDPLSFMFQYNGSQISDLTYSNIYTVAMQTLCLGACGEGQFFNYSSCLSCQQFMPGCVSCSSRYLCHQCGSGLVLNANYGGCGGCSDRFYYATASSSCKACPFDCLTCDSNNNCITCQSLSDHRTLTGSRCAPLPGYYENNQTVAAKCPEGCSACSSGTSCSACSSNYVLQSGLCVLNTTSGCAPRQFDYYGSCLACPYDCYTCNPSSYCLTCNDTTDFRVLSGARCVPKAGYY
jgi:hypothetical protein